MQITSSKTISDRRLSQTTRPGQRAEYQEWRKKLQESKEGEKKTPVCDLIIPYDENGLKFYSLHLLVGHPDRPILFLLTDTEPEDTNITSDDGWYYVFYRSPYVLWWQDSKINEFNEWTKSALKTIGAEEFDKEKIQGQDRIIYKFKSPLKVGIMDDTADVYATFFEADQAAIENLERGDKQ